MRVGRDRARPGERALAPYSRRIGPDPASTDIACVGGVIANNSGGMRCGVVHDAYQTLRAMKLVLPSGTVVDTEAPDAEERFAEAEPELCRGLPEIRDEIRADAELAERIRRKFRIKNTMGYRLCAFLDADTPLEIFRRLVVGSEGTLAFVAEAVFETVPHPRGSTAAMLIFPDIDTAVASVPALVESGATAVELMLTLTLKAARRSSRSRRSGRTRRGRRPRSSSSSARTTPPSWRSGRPPRRRSSRTTRSFSRPIQHRPRGDRALLARARGMHGLVGRMRPPHTALIVEDVCVRPSGSPSARRTCASCWAARLPPRRGRPRIGRNLHFMLTPEFAQDRSTSATRLHGRARGPDRRQVRRLAEGRARHGREHGPFVEREWGAKATELMRRIKRLADPDGVLAPGVILNDDPAATSRTRR